MKKCCLMILCFLLLCPSPCRAETLTLISHAQDETLKRFQEMHPEITLQKDYFFSDQYLTGDQLFADMLTRQFQYDHFQLFCSQYDLLRLMEKGYLLDLTDDPTIAGLLSRMYPNILEQVSLNGRIYAVPRGLYFHIDAVDPEGWAAAGLSPEDVPKSFEGWLDFLDAWCDRIEQAPEDGIRVIWGFDDALYNSATYASSLIQTLLSDHIMQLQYAGESLHFDDSTLVSLLERARDAGTRLYQLEQPYITWDHEGKHFGLWSTMAGSGFPADMRYVIFSRLTDDQPALMPASMSVYAGYAASKVPQAVTDLMALDAQAELADPRFGTFYLYPEIQPRTADHWEERRDDLLASIAELEKALQKPGLSHETQEDLTIQLSRARDSYDLIMTDGQRYLYSPAQYENYHQYEAALFFTRPSVLSPGTAAYLSMDQLIRRYAAGQMTTDQFVYELDHMARIMELEAQ